MWRSLIAAGIVYGLGHPSFEAYRPAALDRPLEAFHRDVDRVAEDSARAIAAINAGWFVRLYEKAVEGAGPAKPGT